MTRPRRRRLATATVAGVAGVGGLLGSYLAAGFTGSFVAAPVSDVVVALTPDAVVTFAILALGGLGQQLGFALALALTALLLAAAAAAGLLAAARAGEPVLGGPAAGLLAWLVALGLTGRPVLALGAAAPPAVVVAGWLLGRSDGADRPGQADRRRVVTLTVGVLAFGGIGAALRPDDDAPAEPVETPEDVDGLLADATEKSLDVDGLTGLVSPVGEFYEVDINPVNPTVDREEWSLSVTGAVDEELSFDYEDVTGLEAEHRFVTLRCVGEPLNGKKMDNALWTGVPVSRLLDSAGADLPDECCVMLRAADGFFEEFPLAALRDGFLAYRMNGRPLPDGHGAPLRALIPGHWGEVNVKWLTEIEVLEEEVDGYWERRGWHGTGPVNTVAKLHAVNHLDDGSVQVGGHAYAGTRGVSRVEVSTDGGATWSDARLSEPLPGEDVWRQWAYSFRPDGDHEVVVRAVDGEGTVQSGERSTAVPSGASGWVSRTVSG